MLSVDELTRLYKYSVSVGMEPLVEVQTAGEMATAVQLGAKVIGVNNRNLENFEVDLKTTSRLRSMVPEETILCALSGINTRQDVIDCKEDGVGAVLVGEAIMRAPDASQFIRQLCSGAMEPLRRDEAGHLLVKICGTRSPEAALAAVESGADMVGMILVPGTKRCVSEEAALAISKAVREYPGSGFAKISSTRPNQAADFFDLAKGALSAGRPLLVGVFRSQPLEEVLAKQARYRLDVVQLHGDEPVEWARLIPAPVIRTFKPGQPGLGLRGYHVAPLLDSGSGSGKLLDMSAVEAELAGDEGLSVLLAGGLTPENVAESVAAIGKSSSRVLGVDVSSGVEEDGKQSLEKIRAFVRAAKAIR